MYSNINENYSKKQAKLKSLHRPIRKINRYSSVSKPPSISEQEEMQLMEVEKKQVSETKILEKISLKGMRLITLRLEKNITQKELADALEIDKILISQYEGEIIKPDFETVERLANFFGVTAEYLVDNPISEVISYQDQDQVSKDIFRNTNRDKVLQRKGLRPEYMAIAEEIQDAGIEIVDVKAFIAMIKKYRY